MNYFTKNKIWSAAIIILFAANIATLIFFGVVRTDAVHTQEVYAPQTNAGDYLVHELQFTATQQKKFDELKQQHQQQVRAIRDSMRNAKDKLFNLLQKENYSDSELNNASANAAKMQQQLELATFNHFKLVKAICTPQQQKHFSEIIQTVLRQMAPPPLGEQPPGNSRHPGGPPPPRGPMPPGNPPPPPQ